MAIIPQYNAGNPAQSQAPVMEQERGGVRMNASSELAALGNLAGTLARGNRPVDSVSADMGTGFFRGVSAIGDGVKEVGNVIFGIRARVAEAKNDADENDAQIAMDQEALAFEKAKKDMPPHLWEENWSGRMSKFGDSYMTGRDLSPAAKDRITQRLNSFASAQSVRVGVEALSVQTQLGKRATMFEMERAVEAQSPDMVKMLSKRLVANGYAFDDEAAMIEYRALDEIDAKRVESAVMRADTFIMQGMYPEAREQLVSAPFKSADEKNLKLAEFDTKIVVAGIELEYGNRLDNGEGPDAIKRELTARNEDGSFKVHPELSPSSRARILQPVYAESSREYTALIKGADDMIANGGISDEAQLAEYFGDKEIDGTNKLTLLKKLKGEVVKTEESIMKLQSDAANYDPSKDTEDGEAHRAQMNAIILTLGDDPRAESILKTLEKRKQGQPLTLAESIYGTKVKEIESLRDAAADYQLPAAKLTMEERGGKKVFVDYSQVPEPGDPSRFEKESGSLWWKGTMAGKVINVSQDDRVKLETALNEDRNGFDGDKLKGIYVTDINKKADADMETAKVVNEISRRAEIGEVTESNMDEEYKRATAPIRVKAGEKRIDSTFGELEFPGGGGLKETGPSAMFDPAATSEWIKNYQIPF